MFDGFVKSRKVPVVVIPRKRESSKINPAAGVTVLETFYETIILSCL